MKQIKVLGVIAVALTLGLSACGKPNQDTCKHQYGDWEVVTPKTCTTDGSQKRTCSKCGKEETKKINKGHEYGEWIIDSAASCTAEGAKHRICSVCQNRDDAVIDKVDHTWGEWETVTAADCTNAGSRKHACSVCGTEESETVQALGHTWGEWETVTEPDCEHKGSRKHTCSVCGVEESEDVAALGHQLKAIGGEQQAPAGEATVRLYECERCHITYLGFSADEPSEASLPHLRKGDHDGMRFFGRPIGNALELDPDTGTSINKQNNEVVYDKNETGDFFEYIFTLNDTQAATLATCRMYCDARPADHLNSSGYGSPTINDFWAYARSSDDWTPGYYIDNNPDHLQWEKNDDGSYKLDEGGNKIPVMVDEIDHTTKEKTGNQIQMGARIEDYRYILYVDGNPVDFDPDTAVPCKGSGENMERAEYVLPYTFHLHAGQNKISLRMAGGYRSEFYNFIFRPYVAPTPITVNESTLEVREGKTAQITSSMEGLQYVSSNTGVATVDANGLVTGVKAGSATITVSKEGNYKEAKVAVTVLEKEGIVTLNLADGVLAPADGADPYNSSYSGSWLRNFKKDTTLTYTFQSELAGKFDIQLGLRGAIADLSTVMAIKVNNNDVAVSGSVSSNSAAVDTIVGKADLTDGENTMVITILADESGLYLKTLKFLPSEPVKVWTDDEIKAGLSNQSATKVTGKYSNDSAETFTAYKINNSGDNITLTVNSKGAQHVKLQLKLCTKFSNLSKCGIWWQLPNNAGSDIANVVQKTEIKLGTETLDVPEEKSLTYTNLGSYKPSQSPDAKDGSSALSAPVWVDMIEMDLADGENTINVKYLDGGYSYWIAGARVL